MKTAFRKSVACACITNCTWLTGEVQRMSAGVYECEGDAAWMESCAQVRRRGEEQYRRTGSGGQGKQVEGELSVAMIWNERWGGWL